jgi:hypothetical protein
MDLKKKILNVIVSDFVDLNLLKDVLNKNNLQNSAIQLVDWQYLPYGKVVNSVTGNVEEKIIPLKRHPSIEEALAQITEKVLKI